MEKELINGNSQVITEENMINTEEEDQNFSFSNFRDMENIKVTNTKKEFSHDNYKSLSVPKYRDNQKFILTPKQKKILENSEIKEQIIHKQIKNLNIAQEKKKNILEIKHQREMLKKIKEENKEKNRLHYTEVKKERKLINTIAAENTVKCINTNNHKFLQIKKEMVEAKNEIYKNRIKKIEDYLFLKEKLIKDKFALKNLKIGK
jgi:hypothetical protein